MPDSKAPTGAVQSQLLFQRAHKSALGLAFGVIAGVGIFALTALHLAFHVEDRGLPLYLLGQYFEGYAVTWPGAFIGLAWGLVVGFIGGWLLGFIHNFTVGVWMLIVRTKRDLRQTGNFLDHI
jgi:hypothetical protein